MRKGRPSRSPKKRYAEAEAGHVEVHWGNSFLGTRDCRQRWPVFLAGVLVFAGCWRIAVDRAQFDAASKVDSALSMQQTRSTPAPEAPYDAPSTLFRASPRVEDVTREEFHRYVSACSFAERHPTIRAIHFSRRVAFAKGRLRRAHACQRASCPPATSSSQSNLRANAPSIFRLFTSGRWQATKTPMASDILFAGAPRVAERARDSDKLHVWKANAGDRPDATGRVQHTVARLSSRHAGRYCEQRRSALKAC